MKKRNYLPIIIVAAILLVVGYVASKSYLKVPERIFDKSYCERDSDCVPAQCCHSTSVVSKKFAPSCEGIVCTQECRPGTIDCGCGKPVCINNKCEVLWTRTYSWC